MKSRTYKLCLLAAFVAASCLAPSCTKLNEEVYSDIKPEDFYKDKTQVMSAFLRPYSHSRWLVSESDYWLLNELSADQFAWPQKGKHGYDNGNWIRLHRHTWTPDETTVYNAWTGFWNGVGYCNQVLGDFEQQKEAIAKAGFDEATRHSMLAEIKVLRAWYYMLMMDVFGNVPIVTEVPESAKPTNPPTKKRAEVFAFAEKELKENIPALPLSNPARINRAAGFAILAKLYLNAPVYIQQNKWKECIAACDSILNGPTGAGFKLDGEPLAPFTATNENSKENLWVFAHDWKQTSGIGRMNALYHYANQFSLDLDFQPYNGVVVVEAAYDAFKDKDQRKQQEFLIGPQYKYGTREPVLCTEEYKGKPLVLVKWIRRDSDGTGKSDMTSGEENSGARIIKYQMVSKSNPNYRNNDWVVSRLSEVYFMKAEALMRQAGGTAPQEAVDLVNAVKQRAFKAEDWDAAKYTTTTLTMNELLAERGREFIFEGVRRMDLIRFNKFTGTWWDKTTSPKTRELFPIPARMLSNNPNLQQNEGY
jgi:hypothetical protein